MARAMSSVGMSYVAVFLTIALLYGGGVVCFSTATGVDHPLFDISPGQGVLAGWILNIVGTIPTGVCVFFWWAFAAVGPYLDDDPDTVFNANDSSKALIIVFLCCQVAFLATVVYLRHEILARSQASSYCTTCICSFCFTLWLPSCSFAEAMQRAGGAQDTHPQRGPDELPAYVA